MTSQQRAVFETGQPAPLATPREIKPLIIYRLKYREPFGGRIIYTSVFSASRAAQLTASLVEHGYKMLKTRKHSQYFKGREVPFTPNSIFAKPAPCFHITSRAGVTSVEII